MHTPLTDSEMILEKLPETSKDLEKIVLEQEPSFYRAGANAWTVRRVGCRNCYSNEPFYISRQTCGDGDIIQWIIQDSASEFLSVISDLNQPVAVTRSYRHWVALCTTP
jgi:hypothetical protein